MRTHACGMFTSSLRHAFRVSGPMSSSMPQKFAVVASQRTGSTLLIRSLDSSPDIFCAGELFHAGPGIHHPEYQFPYRLFGSRKLSRIVRSQFRRSSTQDHLRDFYAKASIGSKAVGFKLMVAHAQTFPAIMPFLRSIGVTFLYLLREDTFATALSFYKAKLSGVFHSDKPGPRTSSRDISADPDEFKALLLTCAADKSRIIELQEQFGGHLMSYEDMTGDWDRFVSRIGTILELPLLRLDRTLKRVGSEGSSMRVINEEQLRDLCQGRTK